MGRMSNKYHCEGWWYHIVLGTFLYILAVLISQKGKINLILLLFIHYLDTSNKLKEAPNPVVYTYLQTKAQF